MGTLYAQIVDAVGEEGDCGGFLLETLEGRNLSKLIGVGQFFPCSSLLTRALSRDLPQDL